VANPPAPERWSSAPAKTVVTDIEHPAEAAELLDRLHREILEILIPQEISLGENLSKAVIKTYAKEGLNRDVAMADPLAYLCVLSRVDAKFEEFAMLNNEEGLKRWGSRPATARWLSAAGRNEREIGQRLRQLSLCESMVRRIGRTADVLREIVPRAEVENAIAAVMRNWFAAGYADAMKMDWECVWSARHLLDNQLRNIGLRHAAIVELKQSRTALIEERDGQPGQGAR
jgi:hypothetical protein